MTNDEILRELIATVPDQFVPCAYYDPDGDCIESLFKRESFFAQRVDGAVTVYRSEKTNEIVGSLIKGVRSLLGKHPNINIDVEDGRIRLTHILRARAYVQPDKIEEWVYRDLLKKAEGVYVEKIPQTC